MGTLVHTPDKYHNKSISSPQVQRSIHFNVHKLVSTFNICYLLCPGSTSEKIQDIIGISRYNLKLTYYFGDDRPLNDYGVITNGGRKCHLKGLGVYSVEKITKKQFVELQNDFDPIEAPPGPYKLQPENQGRNSDPINVFRAHRSIRFRIYKDSQLVHLNKV